MTRTRRRRTAQSRKATGIIALVQALTSEQGASDGVLLGRGIAQLIADAYGERATPVPSWVAELVAFYRPSSRNS